MTKRSMLLVCILISGCASNHHLVFFTNSTIGIEIGSEPNSGTPAKFIIGYKRQEGVIDPLIPNYEFESASTRDSSIQKPVSGDTNIVVTPDGTAIPKGTETKPHSVLAKMNFGATGGGSGASAAQWFATGKAAEIIAQAPGIAGAVSGDPENNKAQKLDFDPSDDNTANFAYLVKVYDLLEDFSKTDNAPSDAVTLVATLNGLDQGEFKKAFKQFMWTGATKTDISIADYDPKLGEQSFGNIPAYLKNLDDSQKIAKVFLANSNITVGGSARTKAQTDSALNAVEEYKERYKSGLDKLISDQNVIKMVDYLHENVLLSKAN